MPNLNILSTHALIRSANQLVRPVTFLRDRYFPMGATFNTDDVLYEFKDGNKKLAPFVVPRKGGKAILREGYTMERYTPPFIAPKRPLTVDDLNKRGFGEALYTQLTPEQRQAALIFQDMQDMDDMIARREESMAAETLLTNKCVMKHYADDASKYEEMQIQFYTDSNPNTTTLSVKWNAGSGVNILGDLAVLVRMITSRGLPVTDLVCHPGVADAIVNNADIKEFLDNRRYELGMVVPEMLPAGAAIIARLNVGGRIINVISYDETYTADNGTDTPFITEKWAILTAPNCGQTIYGAVTQIEQEDGVFHTREGRRIPKYVSDATGNTRDIYLASRPLLVPNNKLSWVAFQALA